MHVYDADEHPERRPREHLQRRVAEHLFQFVFADGLSVEHALQYFVQHRGVAARNGLHTERFTRRTVYTQNGLHTGRFTHAEFNSCNSPYHSLLTGVATDAGGVVHDDQAEGEAQREQRGTEAVLYVAVQVEFER
jgi:hypothetical protein